jgi:hypothetical protein
MNVAGFGGVSEIYISSPITYLGLNTSCKFKIKEKRILEVKPYTLICV